MKTLHILLLLLSFSLTAQNWESGRSVATQKSKLQ